MAVALESIFNADAGGIPEDPLALHCGILLRTTRDSLGHRGRHRRNSDR
jgi:hypothetical protein